MPIGNLYGSARHVDNDINDVRNWWCRQVMIIYKRFNKHALAQPAHVAGNDSYGQISSRKLTQSDIFTRWFQLKLYLLVFFFSSSVCVYELNTADRSSAIYLMNLNFIQFYESDWNNQRVEKQNRRMIFFFHSVVNFSTISIQSSSLLTHTHRFTAFSGYNNIIFFSPFSLLVSFWLLLK